MTTCLFSTGGRTPWKKRDRGPEAHSIQADKQSPDRYGTIKNTGAENAMFFSMHSDERFMRQHSFAIGTLTSLLLYLVILLPQKNNFGTLMDRGYINERLRIRRLTKDLH
jgi:hypothetical protein